MLARVYRTQQINLSIKKTNSPRDDVARRDMKYKIKISGVEYKSFFCEKTNVARLRST